MKKNVTIVTGIGCKQNEINECLDSFKTTAAVIKLGMTGMHPVDEIKDTEEAINFLINENIVVYTNSDHVINMLRVMYAKGQISSLSAIHFNKSGRHEITAEKIPMGSDGKESGHFDIEWSDYPLDFLDMWSNLMGQCWAVKN